MNVASSALQRGDLLIHEGAEPGKGFVVVGAVPDEIVGNLGGRLVGDAYQMAFEGIFCREVDKAAPPRRGRFAWGSKAKRTASSGNSALLGSALSAVHGLAFAGDFVCAIIPVASFSQHK